MSLQDEQDEEGAVDTALRVWRQGDFSLDSGLEFIYLAGTTHPHSPDFEQFAPPSGDREVIEPKATPVADEVCGLVVLSQTCDLVRGCRSRPYVEVAPLVEVPEELLRETRRLRRPAFAYVPLAAEKRLVADLDRTMTVEKAVVAHWHRQQGCQTDEERRAFADALTRKRARFAFPDDFVAAASQLQDRLIKKHARATGEGAHLRAVREIRVQAAPSWDDGEVALSWWFVTDNDPDEVPADWLTHMDKWLSLFDWEQRFSLELRVACRLEDMTARDYVASDRLDLDRLSAQ